jgi:hypothetical protein
VKNEKVVRSNIAKVIVVLGDIHDTYRKVLELVPELPPGANIMNQLAEAHALLDEALKAAEPTMGETEE